MPNVQALLRDAVAAFGQGRLEDAEAVCHAILEQAPNQVDAWRLLGTIALRRGDFQAAVKLFDRAVTADPQQAVTHRELGLALHNLGRLAEAAASYGRALALRPDYAEAAYGRGNAYVALGRPAEALADYERVLARHPDHPETLNNRGTALLALGQAKAALVNYDRALAHRPDYAEALANRAKALSALLRDREALASYDRALALDGESADFWAGRGRVLFALTELDHALESYDHALSIDPYHVEALGGRGTALNILGRRAEAVRDFGRLLESRPDAPYVFGDWLLTRLHSCDWQDFAALVERAERAVAAGEAAIRPFQLLAVSASPALQRQAAERYCARFYPTADRPLWDGMPYRHERIRVAYLSADFHGHATAHLLTELIERHDRTRFEVIGISYGRGFEDPWRARLMRAFDRFLDLKDRTDRDIAQILRELEIDIAIDLKGYTLDGRPGILALRPAPIQVNYLGYPGTLGAPYIDYLIADRIVIPEAHEACYDENIACLPDSYQPNDRQRPIGDDGLGRPEHGLPERGFVFCCFNSSYKLTPKIFAVWMCLLRRVEGSVLWLLDGGPAVQVNLRRAAEALGVAGGRLIFAARAGQAEHLARHRHADLFLDCLPCGGHTTVSDALWAGLPAVTCLGTSFAGRVAASLLTAAGLAELVAEDLDGYETLALSLALDRERLAEVKARLARERATCALFDTPRYCRHIEAAYETMWQRRQRGAAPAGFTVQPMR